MAAADPRIGTDLAGYRIVDVIGRGGMGVVYLAEHHGLRRRAALKILAPELAADRNFRERFAAESRLAASIDHPNIVPIYEAGEVDGTLFIAMRYVAGVDLRARLDATGPLDPEVTVRVLAPIADALDAAHAVGLVHRDVKPANILLDRRDDHPYLTDFGLTKETGTGASGLTQTGQFLGTPDYIAPEQITGGSLDGRADQFALACVAYEALTGSPPHRRETDLATLIAHVNDPPPDVRALRPDLPAGLSGVVARGLARSPDARFGDCRALIGAIADGLAAVAEHPGPVLIASEPAAPATVICPNCGAANPTRARFCLDCASPLGATPATPSRETRKLVTILFSDVAGSTALGESLDPETVRAVMHRYFAVMKRVIEAHGGTVEKFIGDAVMAVFGIPVVHEDDALRAVRAAVAMQAELAALDVEVAAGRGFAIRFRTGINTGEVVAGDTAGGGTMVTGDPVNTAARLEASAPPGEIYLGRLTWQLVRDAVTVEPVEPLDAKGKAYPVPAYRLLTVDPDVAGHLRRLDTPLVGRERDLARLVQAFRAIEAERFCQLFTLLGAAGVGKSRLVAEFIASVAGDATVLRGRCLSYGEGITYWPIAEIVRAAAGIEETDTAEAARIKIRSLVEGERDADTVAARVASAIGLVNEPVPQEEVFWAIRKLLEHVARERPLVVVIEDVHWAEPTLLDLVEHIADWSRDAAILLLCPARPELLETRAGWGGGKLNSTTVLLEPLGTEATARLIAALPGGSAVPVAVEARVAAAAEGNPLFIEEFLGMLIDDGLLVQAADGNWSAADALAEVRIPASISALLSARLERLAPDERAVAERASVVGRVFEQAAVTELASDTLRPEVARSLLGLVRKELVRPERSDLAAGDAFKFRHILIRDAAYEALPKSERAVLHERFADWLERTVGERLAESEEIVGYHLEGAHRYRTELGETGDHVAVLAHRAGSRLAAAGGRAFGRSDFAAAAGLLSRATTVFPIGSTERLQLMPDLGFAVFNLGRLADADALLASAVDEAIAADQTRLATHADLERLLIQCLIVFPGSMRQAADAAIPLLERDGDDLGLARAYLLVASASWTGGRVDEAIAARGRALEYAAKAGDLRTGRRTMFWGAEFYGPMPAIRAIAGLEALLTAISADPMRRAEALFSLAGLYAMRGRVDDARAAYGGVRAVMDDLGAAVMAGASAEIGTFAELIIGDADRAEEVAQFGIAELERFKATAVLLNMRGLQSMAYGRQRRYGEALALADRVIAETDPDDTGTQVIGHIGRAVAMTGLRDSTSGVEAARIAVRIAETTDFVTSQVEALIALAEAHEASGEIDAARVAATSALEICRAKENLMGERRVVGILDRL